MPSAKNRDSEPRVAPSKRALERVLAVVAIEGERAPDELPSFTPFARFLAVLRAAPHPNDALDHAIALLEENADLARGARAFVARVIRHIRPMGAFADLGLLPAHGLVTELRERFIGKVLPSHRPPHDLIEILGAIVGSSRRHAEWVEAADPVRVRRLLALLTPDDDGARAALLAGTLRSIEVLSHRLAAAGEDPGLFAHAPDTMDYDSPFLAQAAEVTRVTAAMRARWLGEHGETDTDIAHARVLIGQCREQIARIRRAVPRSGATVRLTYDLERADDLITRLLLLLDTVDADRDRAMEARVSLVRALVRARVERGRLGPVLARGAHLVAKEIVSHAGRTGEHYITRTGGEYARMWARAAGAGLIVAVMAAIKAGASALHAPPGIEVALFSANYAIGFIVVQFLGLTIATKQPAMTAAALASSIDAQPTDTKELVGTIVCITRSQIAAILGNCLIAFPAAYFLSLGFAAIFGAPVAGEEKAAHMMHDIDGLESYALAHAAITGVWLALAGIAAGYASNSVIARHVPDRITRSRPLCRLLGVRGAARLAEFSRRWTGPTTGCIVLGVLLGSTGTVGELLGIPIDIRHVSFSTANFGLASATLGLESVDAGRAIATIAGIGALNLAVSFSVSLALAMRARGQRLSDAPGLMRGLRRALVADVLGFLLPIGRTARIAPETLDKEAEAAE